jgi:hypothetical protein
MRPPRARPFISANETPRPYRDVVAERNREDPHFRARERVLADVARLEGEAADARDPGEAKRLQCEAEALRCALAERPPPRR